MSAAGFNVVISHRCTVRGAVVEPGACVVLSANEARALLDTGRGALQDEADEIPLQAALWAALTASFVNAAPFYGQSADAAAQQLDDIAQQRRPKNPIGFIWSTTGSGDPPQS